MANPAAISQYLSWRLSTLGGIKYKLLEGYPTIQMDSEATVVVEKYLMRSQDAGAFAAESKPPPYVVGLFIVQPPYRMLPGSGGWAVTMNVTFAPHGDGLPWDPFLIDTGAPAGTYADLCEATITYSTGKAAEDRDPNDPQTFLEHSIQIGGEFYQLKTAEQKYDEDTAGKIIPAPDAPGMHKAVSTIEHNMRWPFVLSPAWTTIFQTLGKCNNTVLPLFKNAPVDTVLFTGVSGQQKYVWDGATAASQPWSMDFKFSQRCLRGQKADGAGNLDVTWNHCMLPSATGGIDGIWVKPYYLKGADKIYMYEPGDLLTLFRAA